MTDHMCSTSSRSSAETWESGSGGVGHVEAFLGERYVQLNSITYGLHLGYYRLEILQGTSYC